MDVILQQLQCKKCWKSFMKTQCRRNKIAPTLANTFTIVKMRKFYEKLVSMEAPSKQRMKSSVWLENQLKAYQWTLVALSGCRGLLIQHFTANQWNYLSAIFNKEESVLEYEGVKLINERSAVKRKWQPEETNILEAIVKQDPSNNKWNQIARALFDNSSKEYFRTGKQCRQRWLNHLDPAKKHGQWDNAEDRKIAAFILSSGKKWSEIAKSLDNHRTEHMVKNRFKTLTIRLRKKYSEARDERELLEKFLAETNAEADGQSSEEEREDLEVDGLPVMESGLEEQGQFQAQNNENLDKCAGLRECDMQQVVTPCPIIYQTFTPTFLNTPNSLTFLMNYSFDQFEKNQNLFLKNT